MLGLALLCSLIALIALAMGYDLWAESLMDIAVVAFALFLAISAVAAVAYLILWWKGRQLEREEREYRLQQQKRSGPSSRPAENNA